VKSSGERGGRPLVLAAHGSRDPRSAATIRQLAGRVAARWAGPVTAAFLDFDQPSVADALRTYSDAPIVLPLLLTSAYHGRVDLPQVVRACGVGEITEVLGPAEPGVAPDHRLVAALLRRVSELESEFDGLVLIAAGTSHSPARSTVDGVAAALSTVLHVPCLVGYASASEPTAAQAVAAVRVLGATRIVAASYFLAAGRLYDAAAASARAAGALTVAAPLGDAPEIVDLVLHRAVAADEQAAPAAAVAA
jgi:sirohydrochlorin ferrochelatase